MGDLKLSTTRANTSTSTDAALARNRARAQASAVAPDQPCAVENLAARADADLFVRLLETFDAQAAPDVGAQLMRGTDKWDSHCDHLLLEIRTFLGGLDRERHRHDRPMRLRLDSER